MRELRYTLRARRDLVQIRRYIAKRSDSKRVAAGFIAKLRAHCKFLAELPGTMGRARPDLDERLRTSTFGSFIIVFQYRENYFEVVAIIERHRDIGAMFEEEW